MDDNEHPPKNWGDWRQCRLCGVIQPPRSLDADKHCVDKKWCEDFRSSKGAEKLQALPPGGKTQ